MMIIGQQQRAKTVAILLLLVFQTCSVDAWRRSNTGAANKKHKNAPARLAPTTTSTRQKHKQLPTPLRDQTRGGFTPHAPPNTRQRIRNLFSVGTATLTPPVSSKQRWHRPPPPPSVDFDSTYDVDVIDGDLYLPSHRNEQVERYHGHAPATTNVESLKQQVARTSREAELIAQWEGQQRFAQARKQAKNTALSRLDMALFAAYFCNLVAATIPVILMPLVAAEQVAVAGTAAMSASAVVAAIASISTLGGGLGKLLNGFVCQFMGGSRSSTIYLVGLAAASLGLSLSPASHAGWILALVEFFASIQWTACSVVLANHYREPAKFAKGITILSLASTSGQIAAKMGGTTLLKYSSSSWRTVAQLACAIALVGAAIVKTLVPEHPYDEASVQRRYNPQPQERQQPSQQQSIGQSLQAVLRSPLFWQVGIAHATAMLARTSDRILGAFFHQTTSLPRSVCGGLTAFITVGFVHGLMRGRKFHQLQDTQSKTQMLSKAYSMSALAAVAMAICSSTWIQAIFFPSKQVLAATITILTGILSSNISFQFYQLPAMVAATFGQNKALCLSLLDAFGYFFAATVWALTGKIVASGGQHGWALAWLVLAGMFGAGGKTMMNVIPGVLLQQQQQQRRRQTATP